MKISADRLQSLPGREKYFEPVLFEILERRTGKKAVPSHFAGDLFVIDQRK